jgi:hypothetical protein
LLERLQKRAHRGKEGAADQSIHVRKMGLPTARNGEPSRMKNVSIESSGGKKMSLG